jgi:ribosomal protein L11 methyltransferase
VPYVRRRYRVSVADEETAVAELWLAETLGVESEAAPDGAVVLTAYFEGAGATVMVARFGGGTLDAFEEVELPDTDWMAEYRRQAQPFALGARLVVDPREPEDADCFSAAAAGEPAAAERRLLRLPARTAFGIGSHESTSLAIDLLEAEDLRGRRVLDVGTGTGILAFAALAWGAAVVVAFDADPVAAFQARTNSRLNQLRPRLFAGRPAALAPADGASAHPGGPAGGFDLALVNVVPEQILPDLDDLLPALARAGGVILSGLLAQRAAEVADHFAARGFAVVDRRAAGEWAALRLAPVPT